MTLGVALMLLVFSATTAFHGPTAVPVTELDSMFDSEQQLMEVSNESAQRNSDVGTIHIGLGILFVALGVVLVRRLSATTPALLLGGVLLILLGAPGGAGTSGPLDGLFGLLGGVLPGALNDAGDARDIARFVVLLVGVVLLAVLIHLRWDGGSSHHGEGAVDS